MKETLLPCGECRIRKQFFISAQQKALYYAYPNSKRENVLVEEKPKLALADKIDHFPTVKASSPREVAKTSLISVTKASPNNYPNPRIMQAARTALANYRKGLV